MNSLEDIYNQIEDEAKKIAKEDTGYDPDRDEELGRYKPKLVDFQLRVRYYKRGAFPYGEKLHEAEQKVERYEKALKDIGRWELATGKKVRVTYLDILKDIMRVVNNALTPKTSTDE